MRFEELPDSTATSRGQRTCLAEGKDDGEAVPVRKSAPATGRGQLHARRNLSVIVLGLICDYSVLEYAFHILPGAPRVNIAHDTANVGPLGSRRAELFQARKLRRVSDR